MKRVGGARLIRGKYFARVRVGGGKRPSFPLPGCTTQEQADARAVDIAEVAQLLLTAGRSVDIEEIGKALGAAKTAREVQIIKLGAAKLAETSAPLAEGATFAQVGERWTSGELAKAYPDHVRAKDHRRDIQILRDKVNPLIGPIPIGLVSLDDCDRVMAACDAPAGSAQRRHVAQVMHRIMVMAAYPLKLIKVSPLPKGWLPKLGPEKAKSYLYPDEERRLLRCKDIELGYRILYGFLAREGCRASEAIALEWTDLDLRRGGLTLDENKTDDPRAWALDPGVTRALKWWKDNGASKKGPFAGLTARHLAERLRDDLQRAKVGREKLFEQSDRRRHMFAHDLRGTFVTLSLAAGKTETWVSDRTGHASTLMIAKYRRMARTANELRLGSLTPLDKALPELRGGDRVGQHDVSTSPSGGGEKS